MNNKKTNKSRGETTISSSSHGISSLLKDIYSKTDSTFILLMFLTIMNAMVDGLRIASAFLILPIIGIPTTNPLTTTGISLFEKASIDEFYVDLTGMDKYFGCYQFASELRARITRESGLPISFLRTCSKS